MEVTNKVIEQIGAGDKDQIVAYNKMDIAKSVPLDVSGHEVCIFLQRREKTSMFWWKRSGRRFLRSCGNDAADPVSARGYHIVSL